MAKIMMNLMTSCEKEDMAEKINGCEYYAQEKLPGEKRRLIPSGRVDHPVPGTTQDGFNLGYELKKCVYPATYPSRLTMVLYTGFYGTISPFFSYGAIIAP